MLEPANMRVALVIVLGTIMLAVTACNTDRPTAEDSPGTGIVERVIDGDTIDVRIGGRDERVRLIGIDTPEIATPDHEAECFGPEAHRHSAELLPLGTTVYMQRDVVGRDDYGRLLAYVFRSDDDLFVNERIMVDGFARPLTIEPNSAHRRRFVEAAGAAQRSSLGLWGACTS